MYRQLILFIMILALVAVLASASFASQVLAFHYSWYGTPAYSGEWRHWNGPGHNPTKKNSSGVPDSATTDHPTDLYDSTDPAAIARHLKLCQDMGIDALIDSWWGVDGPTDKAFQALLLAAEKTPVKVAVYYESAKHKDSTDLVASVVADFKYILSNYGKSPAYFKVRGKPVIFVYGRAAGQLTAQQWKQALDQVRQKYEVFVDAEATSPAWFGLYDSIHQYNNIKQVQKGVDLDEWFGSLVDNARAKNRVSSVTVMPGYDDSHIGRKDPIVVTEKDGAIYKRMWDAAIKAHPDWVIISTFNEWHEGSEIEPSRENGNVYVDLTRHYADMLKHHR